LEKYRVAEGDGDEDRPLRVAVVDGKTTEKRRGEAVRGFKAGEIDVLILGLAVGKFALSLANVRTVIRHDLTYNADDYVQSLARAQHMESTHRPVLITLHCRDTADDLVIENVAGKLPSITNLSNGDLAAMLRGLGRR
jgi:superfamily II DNA/RNA helicase